MENVIEAWLKPALRNLAGPQFTVAELDKEMCRVALNRVPGDRPYYSRVLIRLTRTGILFRHSIRSGSRGATYSLARPELLEDWHAGRKKFPSGR